MSVYAFKSEALQAAFDSQDGLRDGASQLRTRKAGTEAFSFGALTC